MSLFCFWNSLVTFTELFGKELFFGLKDIAIQLDINVSYLQIFEVLVSAENNADYYKIVESVKAMKLLSNFNTEFIFKVKLIEPFRYCFKLIEDEFPQTISKIEVLLT